MTSGDQQVFTRAGEIGGEIGVGADHQTPGKSGAVNWPMSLLERLTTDYAFFGEQRSRHARSGPICFSGVETGKDRSVTEHPWTTQH